MALTPLPRSPIRRLTTVYNHAATVGVDAESKNVHHFAVQTPFLAAVVKGTAFAVQSNQVQARVAVTRGNVDVNDERHGSRVSLAAGQEVASSDDPIDVADIAPVSASTPKPPAPAGQRSSSTTAGGNNNGGGNPDNFGNSPGNSGMPRVTPPAVAATQWRGDRERG